MPAAAPHPSRPVPVPLAGGRRSWRRHEGADAGPGAAAAAPFLPERAQVGALQWLLRLHRRSLFHLLLLGGTGVERARLALEFHHGSLLRQGPFVRVRGDRDEERLQCALECALSAVKCERPDSPLRESQGGTLFVDRVSRLSLATQNLLLRFLDSLPPVASGHRAWSGRLAVGSAEPLESAVARGRFLPALYDLLDKIRVELGAGTPGAEQ